MSRTKKYRFMTKPDPHQRQALIKSIRMKRFGIFFQQRVGKTKVALDVCGATSVWYGVRRVIIISPLSVRLEWMAQINQHLRDEVGAEAYLFPASNEYKYKEKRADLLKMTSETDRLTFLIMNYDALSSEEVQRLKKWNPDILIFDEAHLLKNANSQRCKRAYSLSKEVERVLALTGTPMPKKPHDVFGLFKVLDPTVFGTKWKKFRDRYCIMGGYMGKQIIGYQNTDELSRKVASCSIRVLRKDVMDEPKVEHVVVPVEFEAKARKFYDRLRQAFIAQLDAETKVTADMAIVRMTRLQQICGGFVPDNDGVVHEISKAKQKATVELASTIIEGGEQVVIFHKYRREGAGIEDALRRLGYRVAGYNGDTPESDRGTARKLFQSGELDAIVVQISTGAMGVSFDRACKNIFFSLTYRLEEVLQARDRVMGRNQKNDVTNYYMAINKSVDHKIMTALARDEDLTSGLSDRWRWVMED